MITVFYAGKVVTRCKTNRQYNEYRSGCGPEIYNGGYTHFRDDTMGKHWYRMDSTPCLLEDVPKALRLAIMVLPQ